MYRILKPRGEKEKRKWLGLAAAWAGLPSSFAAWHVYLAHRSTFTSCVIDRADCFQHPVIKPWIKPYGSEQVISSSAIENTPEKGMEPKPAKTGIQKNRQEKNNVRDSVDSFTNN